MTEDNGNKLNQSHLSENIVKFEIEYTVLLCIITTMPTNRMGEFDLVILS